MRRAEPADVPRMLEIASRATTAAQWGQEQYAQMFAEGRLVLLVQEAAEILGFIAGRDTAGDWEIENIAVEEWTRRQGIGSRLLKAFLHQIRCIGATNVFLEVRESNRGARAFYDKWAFAEVGRRRGYYRHPEEDAVVLKFVFPQEH